MASREPEIRPPSGIRASIKTNILKLAMVCKATCD